MTLSLAEALAGGTAAATGRRCKFGKLLDVVPAEQAAELVGRLHGLAWTDARLAKLIGSTDHGHIAASVLSMHRTGSCVCDDATNEGEAT